MDWKLPNANPETPPPGANIADMQHDRTVDGPEDTGAGVVVARGGVAGRQSLLTPLRRMADYRVLPSARPTMPIQRSGDTEGEKSQPVTAAEDETVSLFGGSPRVQAPPAQDDIGATEPLGVGDRAEPRAVSSS